MSVDEQQQDEPRFQRSPTGPWVAPPRGPTGPRVQPRRDAAQPATSAAAYRSAYTWRRMASATFVVVSLLSVGIRAYRDLSRPDAWDFWKDQYLSPSLSATLVKNIDLGGSGRNGLAVSGRIGPAAANWLREQIDATHLVDGDIVLLSSPGGDLNQAIIMGEIIRAHGLATAVGVVDSTGHVRRAYCASACVLVYAGGKTRYGVDGSSLGVHRFVTTTPVRDPVADAQRTTGAVLGYMTKMGVSSRVVEAMSETRDIRWLDSKDALAMNLITDPVRAQ